MARPFPLEAVLRIRQRREEAEERALAALGTQRQRTHATLERVRHEMQQWTGERMREAGHVAPAAAQQSQYARLRLLQEAQTQLQRQLSELDERSRQQRALYLAARSAREMLTELEQQQLAAAARNEERLEQRRLEDLLTARRTKQPLPPVAGE